MLMGLWVSCTLNHLASGSKPGWFQVCSTCLSFSLDQWLPRAYGLFLDTYSRTQTEGAAVVRGMFLSWQITAAQEGMSCEQSYFKASLVRFTNFLMAKASHIAKHKVKRWESILCPLWQGYGWRIHLQGAKIWTNNSIITAASAPCHLLGSSPSIRQ